MGRKKVWPPRVNVHHRGRERVYWNGTWHDLGLAGSAEAKAEYGRLIALWAADPTAAPLTADEYLVATLCRDYLASTAAPADENRREFVVRSVALLLDHHLATAVADFGPRALAAWQSWLCGLTVTDGPKAGGKRYSRSTVLMMVAVVRRVWKWGVAAERVPHDRYAALLTVAPPQKGEARPPKVVGAADPDAARAVLVALRPPVRAAVELLAVTGGRPSEVLSVRPRDVFRAGVVDLPGAGRVDLDAAGVWVYVPDSHKTERYGKPRWLVLGGRARAVLEPFLARHPDAHCFSPAEAVASLRAELRAGRAARGGGSGGNRKPPRADPKRVAGGRYTSGTLRNAVLRACDRIGVGRFTPYQLRHAALSEVDLKLGLDAA